MKAEKINRSYKKPSLSLICPPSLMRRSPPELIIPYLCVRNELEQQEDNQFERLILEREKAAITSDQWFSCTEHVHARGKQDNRSTFTQSLMKKKKPVQFRKSIKRRSPYVKSDKDYDNLINFLRPVKGPTESVINQIRRHNDLHRNNVEAVLMNKKESFKSKMSKFSSRIGLNNNERIFVMNSQDSHIRQMLLENGWVEAASKDSPFFNLKWVYIDHNSDYSKLQEGQFYNHFRNNQELTNKNLLRKNVKNAIASMRPYFPPTFDLENGQDQLAFRKQFFKGEQFLALRFWATEFARRHPIEYQKIVSHPHYVVQKGTSMKPGRTLFTLIKSLHYLEKRCSVMPQLKPRAVVESEGRLDSTFQYLYKFCVSFEALVHPEDTGASKRKPSCPDISQKHLPVDIRSVLSSFRGFKDIQRAMHENEKVRELVNCVMEVLKADKFIQVYLVSLYQAHSPMFENAYGLRNAWISKPSGVSRGSGIKIEQVLQDVVSMKHGKIVQKYIGRPLILKCGRKFDIRQWVLVKSFMPLEAYTFQYCYCRFSSEPYSEANFDSLMVHLTNYSKQKGAFFKGKNIQESIMSEQQLILELKEINDQVEWADVRREMNAQILKTLKCCQYEIEQKAECFEVYGFDIILDSECRPWILQANLSPACSKRSQFIMKYLRDMSEGILDVLQERSPPRNWVSLSSDELLTPGRERQDEAIRSAVKIQKVWRRFMQNRKE